MKSHGMLFSAPMVRALLANTKRQTRRLITARNSLLNGAGVGGHGVLIWAALDWSRAYVDQGPSPAGNAGPYWHVPAQIPGEDELWHRIYPRVQPGDNIWVKETFQPVQLASEVTSWRYRATDEKGLAPWTPSILMPRSASRLTLEVPTVRTERLQDISEEDARAEGVLPAYTRPCFVELNRQFVPNTPENIAAGGVVNHRTAYACLWDDINEHNGWGENPPVWIYDLKRSAA